MSEFVCVGQNIVERRLGVARNAECPRSNHEVGKFFRKAPRMRGVITEVGELGIAAQDLSTGEVLDLTYLELYSFWEAVP